MSRETDSDLCPSLSPVFQLQVTYIIFDNSLDQGKTHSRTESLGGEKGVGRPVENLIRQACSSVPDYDFYLMLIISGGDEQSPSSGHGLDRISDQVNQQLADLVLIPEKGGVRIWEDELMLDVLFLHDIIEQDHRFLNQRVK